MVVSKKGGVKINIEVDRKKIEQVVKFKYLGPILSEDGRCLKDVKVRIGMSKDAFNKRKQLLTKTFSKSVKKRIVKTLIWSVAMYACEHGH